MSRFIIFSLLFFLNIQCSFLFKEPPSLNPKEMLISQINHLVNDPLLDNANIGIYIESLEDSSVIFDLNSYDLFIPASNQKLYTSAVALEKLGPGFVFETNFYSNGQISDSVLSGDLIIQGKGDPSIPGEMNEDNVLKLFQDWADSLTLKGIKKIDGRLIGDESYFSDHKLGEGWNWDDEPYYYSAQISALSFNENIVRLVVSAPDSIGDSLTVSFIPATDYMTLVNNGKICHPDSNSKIEIWRERAQNITELTGRLKKGSRDTVKVTIENPALWFLTIFSAVLNSKGIEITGGLKTLDVMDSLVYDQSKLAFKHSSTPLKDILPVVNKDSNNFYTEQLFKTIAAEVKDEGSANAGSETIKEWLQEIGISDKYAYSVDGSGLSRMNIVSPFATAAVLRNMYSNANFKDFYASLPIAGVDGTLKNRMKDSLAEGVLRAKTGYVRHARNLAGYTKDQSGNYYLFVIMVNNYRVKTSYINQFQDKIAILLSSYIPN